MSTHTDEFILTEATPEENQHFNRLASLRASVAFRGTDSVRIETRPRNGFTLECGVAYTVTGRSNGAKLNRFKAVMELYPHDISAI